MLKKLFSVIVFLAAPLALAENASKPISEPVLEPPTLHSLGVYWIIEGDDNENAKIDLDYRKKGTDEWRKGMPLFRVEKGAHKVEKYGTKLNIPGNGWLFAG